jgi:hypothetical protein
MSIDLKHIEELAKQLLVEHGLDVEGWNFQWDNAKVRFGQCSHKRKQISLSKHLTRLRALEATKNTILHEIAHALVGPRNGHNRIWKTKAKEIGCTGERCSNDVSISPSFKGTCPNCKREIYRHRRKNISCGVCDPGHFNPMFVFRWEKYKA